ncbi:MAG TPA: LexA family transcriptional regulator, partial [Pirellulales bacterium]
AAATGIGSPNGVTCHIRILERKGWIERGPEGSARSIRIAQSGAGLPHLGYVSCGALVEHSPDFETQWIDFNAGWPPGSYLLRAVGDSMIGDGIFDGDVMVVEPTQTAAVGDIVVVDEPGGGQTVKRLTADQAGPLLKPSNPAVRPIRPAPTAKIVGVVVGSFHRFKPRRAT